MKPLMVLLKREWLEWQKVVIGTILVVTFLNLLALLSVARGSSWFHDKLEREGHINMQDIQINDGDAFDLDIRMHGDDVEFYLEGEDADNDINVALDKASRPLAFGLRFGMQGIFLFVLFLSLFYFSDAIYKERADNSTLFYRSLPISDHYLLGSKIGAGLIGVIGLTLFLSLEYLLFLRIAVLVWGAPLNTMAAAVFSRISYVSLLWDWFSYLIYAAIRMAPLALFLMLVGTYVKGRPLLIGIGGPILLSISWAIIFKSGALFVTIGKFFWGFNLALIEQWGIKDHGLNGDALQYGNPWDYIFNLDTLLAIVVSALLYYALWQVYRKNIPTG
ncbi:MAG: hypothetical protein K9N35_09885 [Candidatus Marinimicrobia bacterium]|nr:hypothetical protein [Candidatus Neomarinimicrobiota bacterium]